MPPKRSGRRDGSSSESSLGIRVFFCPTWSRCVRCRLTRNEHPVEQLSPLGFVQSNKNATEPNATVELPSAEDRPNRPIATSHRILSHRVGRPTIRPPRQGFVAHPFVSPAPWSGFFATELRGSAQFHPKFSFGHFEFSEDIRITIRKSLPFCGRRFCRFYRCCRSRSFELQALAAESKRKREASFGASKNRWRQGRKAAAGWVGSTEALFIIAV